MVVVFLAMDDRSVQPWVQLNCAIQPVYTIYTHVSCLAGMDYFGLQLYALYVSPSI
jgi:hypothetical protein